MDLEPAFALLVEEGIALIPPVRQVGPNVVEEVFVQHVDPANGKRGHTTSHLGAVAAGLAM
jgi:hypothetical protein